jgi:hypothetical protein
MLDPQLLGDAAPRSVPNRRPHRYRGGGAGIPLEQLAVQDRERVREIYHRLGEIYALWLGTRPEVDWKGVADRVRAFGGDPLRAHLGALGRPTLARDLAPEWDVRRTLHDLRGGALFALAMYAHILEEGVDDAWVLEASVFLARDQAKMMRNALPDLDAEGRARDEEEEVHWMEDLVRKWDGFRFVGTDPPSHVTMEAGYRGALASCCLEASALDRVIFNTVNNAARFSADGRILLRADLLDAGTVRWLVANAVTPEHRGWLEDRVGGHPSHLFLGGTTRDGAGVGMRSAAQFVASAFGLEEGPEEAVRLGHVGAVLRAGRFLVWFHWPALTPAAEGAAA